MDKLPEIIPLIPNKIFICLKKTSSKPVKISDEIAPDPNIKVGIKSGKMIKGIKRLCCFKVRVKADPYSQ